MAEPSGASGYFTGLFFLIFNMNAVIGNSIVLIASAIQLSTTSLLYIMVAIASVGVILLVFTPTPAGKGAANASATTNAKSIAEQEALLHTDSSIENGKGDGNKSHRRMTPINIDCDSGPGPAVVRPIASVSRTIESTRRASSVSPTLPSQKATEIGVCSTGPVVEHDTGRVSNKSGFLASTSPLATESDMERFAPSTDQLSPTPSLPDAFHPIISTGLDSLATTPDPLPTTAGAVSLSSAYSGPDAGVKIATKDISLFKWLKKVWKVYREPSTKLLSLYMIQQGMGLAFSFSVLPSLTPGAISDIGLLFLSYGLAGCISSVIFGKLYDRYGWQSVVALHVGSTILAYALVFLVFAFDLDYRIHIFTAFVFSIVDTGSNSICNMTITEVRGSLTFLCLLMHALSLCTYRQ